MAFGLQNSVIALTPTGRIDSEFPLGNDGSDIQPSWNSGSLPNLNSQQVGVALSIDLQAAGILVDPGSPASELGFYPVSGTDPRLAGYGYTGTTLTNSNAKAATGVFCLVAVRGSVSKLSDQIAFSITSSQTDTVPPTVPTGITVAPGTGVGTIAVTCDAPADLAPANAPASGVAHVDVYVNSVLASPPSPVIAPTNAMVSPTNVNVGSISSPGAPNAFQNGSAWTLTAAGTGIASATAEQCLFLDFGTTTGAQRIVALIDPYTSSAGTALMGIMIHESAVAGGKFIAIGLRPSNGTVGLYVNSRATTSAASTQVASQINDSNGNSIVAPVYVKIERAADGKTLTVSYSLNGLGWILITTQTIVMNASVHYGLFATSQSAGTEIVGIVEEVAITTPSTLVTTVSATAPASIQLLSVDANNNSSTKSVSITGVPKSAGSAQINFNPGNRFQVGNETHTNDTNAALLAGNSDSQQQINIILALESALGFPRGSLIKGYMAIYRWDQLETAPGVFGGLTSLVAPLLAWCQARGIDLSMAVNGSGNGADGGTHAYGAPSDTFTASYGKVDTPNGYYGSVFVTPSTNNASSIGPIVNFSNAATMARYALLGKAIYAQFGTSIYAYHPTWSEMSITQYDQNAQCAQTFGVGGLYDQLRSYMPRTMLMAAPTYLAFNTHANGTIINDCVKRNFMSSGNFDSCNEDSAGGGVNGRIFTNDAAFRGLQVSGSSLIALTDAGGNPYASMVGNQYDFFTHHSEDSLGGVGTTTGPPSPAARTGDGRLQIKVLHDIQQKSSHCWWASNQRSGCNANRTVNKAGAAANYSDSSNTWSNLVAGIAAVYSTMQQSQYPGTWPQ